MYERCWSTARRDRDQSVTRRRQLSRGEAPMLEADSTSVMSVGSSHLPLRHAVLEEIRRRIIAGAYSPGERLYEDQIAADLDVSRNPVREGCRRSPARASSSSSRDAALAWRSSRRPRRRAVRGARGARGARRQPCRDAPPTPRWRRCAPFVEEGCEAAERGNLTALLALNTRSTRCSPRGGAQRDAGRDDRAPAPPHRVDLLAAHRPARLALVEEHSQIVDAIASGDADTAERAARGRTSRWRGRRTSISANRR